jgi:hypothetical protein
VRAAELLDGRRGVRLGRLLVTTGGRQAAWAPLVDGCSTTLRRAGDDLGDSYGGLCVRLARQRDRQAQVPALVVAWRHARVPNPQAWRRWRPWVRRTGPPLSTTDTHSLG